MENGKLPRIGMKKIELNEYQQRAVNAVCTHGNFVLLTQEEIKGKQKVSLIMKCDAEVIEKGLRQLAATDKAILDIMTNVVIDLQNEK